MASAQQQGPLAGVRVLEIASIGPGPFAGMMLADMGAEVLRVDRASGPPAPAERFDVLARGRRSAAVDLKHPDGAQLLLDLVEQADVLLEGFRPGVMEKLGLGPEVCLARNPRLVYGRMTGWGQDGPLAAAAGHDINYIAVSGSLDPIGRTGDRPVPPLNLVGDFGGGGMLMAFGIVCALLEARTSGAGQVVDAAMVDGSALLAAMMHGMRAAGMWEDRRGANLIDTGAPFYEVYETADGAHVAVGAIEPQFYALLLQILGLEAEDLPSQGDRAQWPALKERFAAVFKTQTLEHWVSAADGIDACLTPVVPMGEAAKHPHNVARGTFTEVDGIVQPAPAPRFSRTPAREVTPPTLAGADTRGVLADWGVAPARVEALLTAGVLASREG